MREKYPRPLPRAAAVTPRSAARGAADPPSRARVVCVAEDGAAAALVRDVLLASLPSLDVHAASPSAVNLLPDAHCIVVADGAAGHGALDLVRRARAAGYGGGAALVVSVPAPPDVLAAAGQLGVGAIVAQGEAAVALPDAVLVLLAADARRAGALPALDAELRRTRQLLAAGAVALRLQHALNNPLTALLAEAQLLEMEEDLPPAHRGAVERIVELCRRTIGVVRQL